MIERPLTNTERAVWRRGRVSLNVVQPVVLERRIARAELQDALERVRPRYPQLALRLRADEAGGVYLTDEGVDMPTVRVVTRPRGWPAEALSELGHDFDWARGPLARFTLVQANDHSTLLFNLYHVLGDGQSLAYLLADVLSAVLDPRLRFSARALPPTMDELCPESALPRLARLALDLARSPSSLVPMSDRDDRRVRSQARWLLAWSLDPEEVRRLVARSRAARCGVHTALCTAFQLASRRVLGNRPRRSGVYVPVDVRRRLRAPVGDAFGLYASEAVSRVRPQPSRSFASEARKIAARIKRDTEHDRVLGLISLASRMHPRLLDRMISYVQARQGIWEGLAISNMGRVTLPASALPLVREYGAAVFGVKRAEKTLGVTTALGRMSFTLTSRKATLDEASLEAIRDEAMEVLRGPW